MDNNQASVIVGGVQAIFSGVMLYFTCRLTEFSRQQAENTRMQTHNMQTPINLSMYEKRFKVYRSIIVLINSTVELPIPQNETDWVKFVDDISNNLKTYWRDSREKIFLLDTDLNEYMKSIEEQIRKYAKTGYPKELNSYEEYAMWSEKINDEQSKLVFLSDDVTEKFKKCLDFKNI